MIPETLILNLKTIIESTVQNFHNLQTEILNIYTKHNLYVPDISNISSGLSYQIEKTITDKIDMCCPGIGYEDVIFRGQLQLEIKVSNKPRIIISKVSNPNNKTYILINHQNCILKAIYILPSAKDYYFSDRTEKSASRYFKYTEFKNFLIKFKY